MTPTTLPPWTELLSKGWSNVKDEYGPNSQEVTSALMALDKLHWLEHVGTPCQERVVVAPANVTVVRSWDEALTIFGDDLRYNANGVL